MVLLLSLAWPALPATRAQERKFVPEECFLADTSLYASIRSVDGLKKGLASTPAGRLLMHPGFLAALGKLPQMGRDLLRAGGGEFTRITGMDPLEALDLLKGEISLSFSGMDSRGMPRIAVAIELGPRRKEILGLFEKLDRQVLSFQEGRELPSLEAGNHRAVLWPAGRDGALARAVLGTHLVLAFPSEGLSPIARLFDGTQKPGGDARSLQQAPFMTVANLGRELPNPAVLVAANARKLLQGVDQDFEVMIDFIRLRSLTAISYELGFRDGDFESRIHVGTPGDGDGLLGVLAGSLEPVRGLEAAFQKIPEGASSILAARVKVGELMRRVTSFFGDGPFNSGEKLPLEDVYKLPPIEFVHFSIWPPAGSLIEDSIALARTSEFEPYGQFMEKAIKANEGSLRSLKVENREIQYLSIGFPGFVSLGDGWTAVSGNVRALRRYLTHYQKGPKLAATSGLLQECRKRLDRSQSLLVLRNGRMQLGAYNTLVSAANLLAPSFEEYLTPLGVDPGLLPPGEEFLDQIGDGFLELNLDPEGITLKTHRALTASGAAPVIAAGAVVAGFLVPTVMKARGRADTVRCAANLREIQKLGMMYADSAGTRYYPHSTKGSIADLQILVSYNDGLRPELFICPSSGQKPAGVDRNGKFQLDGDHCSYELVPWRISNSGPPDAIVAFDRAPYHEGGRIVAYLDSSIEFVKEEEFQQRLAAQRARFNGDSKKEEK